MSTEQRKKLWKRKRSRSRQPEHFSSSSKPSANIAISQIHKPKTKEPSSTIRTGERKENCEDLKEDQDHSSRSQPQQQQQHPYRNLNHNLHTPIPTLQCAMNSQCIPCSYKIATFDIALDTTFTKNVPNTRPELCPRSKSMTATTTPSSSYSYGYRPGMRILTVGDGDFSFSLAMARILFIDADSSSEDNNRTPKSSSKLIATSYESYNTLVKVYGSSIVTTINELESYDNVEVHYKVDATNLRQTLPGAVASSTTKDDNGYNFHRIIWNFPCTAEPNGQDGQNQQFIDNQMLVRTFMNQCATLKGLLHAQLGEIHFMHKTKPPYDQWNLHDIVNSNDNDDVTATTKLSPTKSFEYQGRIVFDKCLLPPYTPRKALDKKSFPCHDACLYVFGWNKNGTGANNNSQSRKSFPLPTFPLMSAGVDDGGNKKKKQPPTLASEESQQRQVTDDVGIVPVTKDLIDKIRKTQLLLGSQQNRKKKC